MTEIQPVVSEHKTEQKKLLKRKCDICDVKWRLNKTDCYKKEQEIVYSDYDHPNDLAYQEKKWGGSIWRCQQCHLNETSHKQKERQQARKIWKQNLQKDIDKERVRFSKTKQK